ncbi:hypothetical protein BZG36_03280 [Bifiguratus adelaidae]|uniref:VHS domain-containing protein n=1 Tax=Bifiguratus adelaidae TaxID=1938954 RepID=A0A261XZW3_9FUNG|nr:hypothetical protein BZG36_03280 [Bifiguratus adelaidae]
MYSCKDITLFIVGFFLPPVAVFFKRGCSVDLLINIALCCLAAVPGIIHAWYIIHKYNDHFEDLEAGGLHYQPLPNEPHSAVSYGAVNNSNLALVRCKVPNVCSRRMDYDEYLRQELFLKLKPDCVELLKVSFVSRSNSARITTLLRGIHQTLTESLESGHARVFNETLREYVLFPLLGLWRRRAKATDNEPMPDDIKDAWLQCILWLLKYGHWQDDMIPEMLKQLLLLFTLCLGGIKRALSHNPDETARQTSISEETKLVAVKCIMAVMPVRRMDGPTDGARYTKALEENQQTVLIVALRSEAFRPVLGPIILSMLDIVRNEQYLDLRMTALDALRCVLVDNIGDPDVLASVLPGVLSDLLHVVVKGHLESRSLVARALDLIRDVISETLADESNNHLVKDITSFQDLRQFAREGKTDNNGDITSHPHDSQEPLSYNVNRTSAWLNGNKHQIKAVLNQLLTRRNHSEPSVRLAFSNLAYKLLSTCTLTLDNSTGILLETLVLYMDDSYSMVSTPTRDHLTAITNHPRFQTSISSTLKQSLTNWMESLPQYLTSSNESSKLNAISLVRGFALMLGHEANTVIRNVWNRVELGWFNGLRMEDDDLGVTEVKGLLEGFDNFALSDPRNESQSVNFPPKRFVFLENARVVQHLKRTLRTIGALADTDILIDHCMNYFAFGNNKDGLWGPAAFVVNELLIGAANLIPTSGELSDNIRYTGTPQAEDSKLHGLAQYIFRALVSLDIVSYPIPDQSITSHNIQTKTITSSPHRDYLSTLCMVLETIATTSLVLKSTFKLELIDALYPIIEHIGVPNARVSTTAQLTLATIAHSCDYASPQDLILDNVDYIVNTISTRLRNIALYPQTPRVFSALIQFAGSSVLPLLSDVIDEMFDGLDAWSLNERICADICTCLLAAVKVISRELDQESSLPTGSEPDSKSARSDGVSAEIAEFVGKYSEFWFGDVEEVAKESKSTEEIGQYFLAQAHKMEAATDEEDDKLGLPTEQELREDLEKTENEMRDAQQAGQLHEAKEAEQPPLTRNQQICVNIVRKTHHFLAAASPRLRSDILKLIRTVIPVLSNRPLELNPLIHTIWPSLIRRLSDPEPYVILNALTLMQAIAEGCGDFLSRRVMDDVWPKFQTLFHAIQQDPAQLHPSHPGYSVYSRPHKALIAILRTLRLIVQHVPLRDEVTFDILSRTRDFLNSLRYHREIQVECIELYRRLQQTHYDAVWIYCSALVPSRSHLEARIKGTFRTIDIPDYMRQGVRGEGNAFALNVNEVLSI